MTQARAKNSELVVTIIILFSIIFYVIGLDVDITNTSTLLSMSIGIVLGLDAFYVQWLEYKRFSSRNISTQSNDRSDRRAKLVSIRRPRGLGRIMLFSIIFSLYGYLKLGMLVGLTHNLDTVTSIGYLFFLGLPVYVFLAFGGFFDIAITVEGLRSSFLSITLYLLGYVVAIIFTSIFFPQNPFLLVAFITRILLGLLLNKLSKRIWQYSFAVTVCLNLLVIFMLVSS